MGRRQLLKIRALSWLIAAMLATSLWLFIAHVPDPDAPETSQMTIRRIDVALPPPPEPPSPLVKRESVDSSAPTIDVVGGSSNALLDFSQKPELSHIEIDKVERPEFEISQLDFDKTLAVDFPILGVENLDDIPRVVSGTLVTIPRELRQQGIERVEARVQIVIDEMGRAFIKELIDPVYPEMVTPIRKYIDNVRFTIPTKDGQPVHAEYLFVITFVYRS